MPRINMDAANIRQNVQLYEGALRRHGQYMRWYTSSRCYCIDEMGRADPACKACLGRGELYSPVTEVRRIDRGMSFGSNIITTKANIKSINRVFNNQNVDLDYSSFLNDTITLSTMLKKGRMYHIDYNEDLTEDYVDEATYEGRGLIRVPIIGVSTIYGDFIGELITVNSVTNTTTSESVNVVSFWENLILTDTYVDEADELEVDCTFVNPVRFLISGISSKERYELSHVAPEADAQLTVPGFYYMGAGDIITLLKAEQRASMVGNSDGSDFHRLPFFHVKSIFKIIDEVGIIADAVLIRNNEIEWGSRIPEKFSITLTYNPTFAVLPDLPTMRYAEDKVFPRKVMLKQWDMFSRRNKRPSAITEGLQQGEMLY